MYKLCDLEPGPKEYVFEDLEIGQSFVENTKVFVCVKLSDNTAFILSYVVKGDVCSQTDREFTYDAKAKVHDVDKWVLCKHDTESKS